MTAIEWSLLLGLLLLTILSALGQAALVNVRKARLRQLSDEGNKEAQTAERLSDNASRLLATTRFVVTLTNLFAGGMVAVLLAPPLADWWQPWLKGTAYPLAFSVVVLLAAILLPAIGQLAPEAIAAQRPERLALWLARPLAVVTAVTTPLVQVTMGIGRAVAGLFGAKTQADLSIVTEEEIKTLVDAAEEEGVIEEDEKEMISSIFELGDTLARQVMVPRMDVTALEVTTPMLEALDRIMQAGYSRVPIYEETIDNVIGVLYAKDLLPYLRDGRIDVPIKSILRPAYFVPETKRASDLLPDLQQRRVHMAIIVDEYGGMAGLVTIEDVLEEIVGEIHDEYDVEEMFVELAGEGEYLMDARVDLDDLNRLMASSLPTEESDTLGGFIYAELGRVPTVGDRVQFEDLSLTVESVAGRRIQKVRVRRLPQAVEAAEEKGQPPVQSGNGSGKDRRHG
ncbi:MAG: HlyC/CorC family transporter [Anaerolineae bacterium]|nr:HlyC/CorC family transporter [Anaerolineae bacterium]